jgi:hypothetical protein
VAAILVCLLILISLILFIQMLLLIWDLLVTSLLGAIIDLVVIILEKDWTVV